jgi:ABC-2 type transport system permease protein
LNRLLPIWQITLKELKSLRDVKMLFLMLISPLAIVLLLGTMLTSIFNSSTPIGEIRVLYQNHSSDSELASYWGAFAERISASGIHLEPAASSTINGISEVENNRYVGYAELSDNGIHYYGSSRSTVESDIAVSVISAFADRYKLAAEIVGDDPAQAKAIMASEGSSEHVTDTSLVANRLPSAMDYYAIAMLTLIVMYGALNAAGSIDIERTRHTAVRLIAAPITKGQIFAGKIIGGLLQNVIYVLITVFICKYMFNVYWGDNLGLVFLVLISQIVFVVSLGLGLSYLIRGKASGAILMIIIQLAAFFGGSYFPLESVTGVMRVIASLSPLEWTNSAILQIIYANNGSAAFQAIVLNIGFSITLLGASLLVMRKREGL